jgi:hypothetical protein
MADCSSFEQIDNATKPLLSAKQPDEIVDYNPAMFRCSRNRVGIDEWPFYEDE